ncbi:hypothetical protein ACOMHN_059792 [Nucella lapillus]
MPDATVAEQPCDLGASKRRLCCVHDALPPCVSAHLTQSLIDLPYAAHPGGGQRGLVRRHTVTTRRRLCPNAGLWSAASTAAIYPSHVISLPANQRPVAVTYVLELSGVARDWRASGISGAGLLPSLSPCVQADRNTLNRL